MKIPSLIPVLEANRKEQISLLKQLRPGLVLQARVASSTQNGIARILIGNNELTARTPAQLQEGAKLQLRVEKGMPQPALKIIQAQIQPPARALLLNALPRQLPPTTVQQTLSQLPAPLVKRNETFAFQVLRVLLPEAPSPTKVTPATVKQAMQQSGIFFEKHLSLGQPQPQDQKLQLLQLLRLFEPQLKARNNVPNEAKQEPQQSTQRSPGEQLFNRLLRLVEGSISRIQSQQAGSLNNDDPGRQVWQFDMPIQLNDKLDFLNLRIQRDEDQNDPENPASPTWKVDIEFDFDNLGGIFSRINLQGESLSASFWSQRDTTALLIERAIPKLEQMLLKAGLQIGIISSLTGKPPRTELVQDNLLDERA